MQNYLHKARFSAMVDDVGLRMLLFAAGIGWFVYLWGLGMPALLAGTALGIMGQLALTHYRRGTVHRRETLLRRRLGGELMLEEMLLAPQKQAHFQAALLLGEKYPLTMEQVTNDGMLCCSGDDRLLVSCIVLPETGEVGQGNILAVQRACRAHGAVRGVACTTGRCSAKVEAWAAEGTIPVKIIRREVLLELAGRACPATDAQLIELGKRKKRLAAAGAGRRILRRDKAKNCWLYGLGLTLMYIVTGLGYYLAPGIICLLLAVGCRCWPEGEKKL